MNNKKYSILIASLTVASLFGVSAAYAIQTLQLGSYATVNQPGQGTYVNYTTNTPDEDTAFITGGNTLLAAGKYGPHDLLVGGKYPSGSRDWSYFGLDTNFNGKGAVIMATVANGSWDNGGVSITLDGQNPFLKVDTFSNYPNHHYPVGDGTGFDFFFFDIGNFEKSGTVPDFKDETGSADGQIKEFTIGVTGLDWIHFDLMALVTNPQGQTNIVTTIDVSSGSHDVTYNDPGTSVPEPATMLLFGAGLAGLAGFARRKVQ